eukprot:TRINITY_DN64597_c0_g1_i1.p1 TRINITY_DN64597_c0_g1~~TRINITY_DN64597_c0_g1_i1.p1  ORF type:complete len:392 (+),score=61.05 TRINITY_DN64597_c0_g1_i1:53-1228(+)
MRFLRYQKIYDRASAYGNVARPANDDEWLVQEKIHGSNFAVYCGLSRDVLDVQYAKRNGFLDFDNDCFYEYQKMDDRLRSNVTNLWRELIASSPAHALGVPGVITQITVHGELFGGWIPTLEEAQLGWNRLFQERTTAGHKAVRKNLSAGPVQEGVYYSENLEFVVFDVALTVEESGAPLSSKDGDRSTKLVFLPYEVTAKLAQKAGFLMSDILLKTRKYEEAVNFNVKQLVSPMALKLSGGHEAMHAFENLAEGVVVRPAGMSVFDVSRGDDAIDVPTRFLLKRKNERFAEEIENCDGGDVRNPYALFRTRIARLVNQNRLAAVLSKDLGNPPMGEVDGWREAAIGQLADDVWESFWDHAWDLGEVDYDLADEFVRVCCRRVVDARLGGT